MNNLINNNVVIVHVEFEDDTFGYLAFDTLPMDSELYFGITRRIDLASKFDCVESAENVVSEIPNLAQFATEFTGTDCVGYNYMQGDSILKSFMCIRTSELGDTDIGDDVYDVHLDYSLYRLACAQHVCHDESKAVPCKTMNQFIDAYGSTGFELDR